MKSAVKKILLSPVTHFNLITVGFLIAIQGIHLHAHHTMSTDVDSYVRGFCKKNLQECERIINSFD